MSKITRVSVWKLFDWGIKLEKLTDKEKGELYFWINYIHGGGCETESGKGYLAQWKESSQERFRFYFENNLEIQVNECEVWADIGSGPYSILFEAPNSITKIIVDPLIIEYQQSRLLPQSILPLNCIAVRSPAESLPFLDTSIDKIFCNNTIDHVDLPMKALKEMVRVLRH